MQKPRIRAIVKFGEVTICSVCNEEISPEKTCDCFRDIDWEKGTGVLTDDGVKNFLISGGYPLQYYLDNVLEITHYYLNQMLEDVISLNKLGLKWEAKGHPDLDTYTVEVNLREFLNVVDTSARTAEKVARVAERMR